MAFKVASPVIRMCLHVLGCFCVCKLVPVYGSWFNLRRGGETSSYILMALFGHLCWTLKLLNAKTLDTCVTNMPAFVCAQVKFMKSKPGAAMVEMGDCYAVERAISHLNHTMLFEQKLNIWYV